MARLQACLIETHRGWHLQLPRGEARFLVHRSASAADVAAAVEQACQAERKSLALAILLDARSVLFSRFELAEVGGSRSRSSLAFHLEAELPVSAEDLLSDFRISENGSVAAVAVEKERVVSLVNELGSRGMRVRNLLPASLVTVQSLVESRRVPERCLLVLLDESSIETLVLERKSVRSWRLTTCGQSLDQVLRLQTAGIDPPPEFVIGSRAHLDARIEEAVHERVDKQGAQFIEVELARLLVDKTWQIVGTQRAWFDIARDPVLEATLSGSSQLRFRQIVVALATCLLIMTAAFAWRATRLRAATRAVREQARDIFRQTFPEANLPSAVVARLKSEHTKVVASRAASGQSIARSTEAITILNKLLLGLPEALDFTVREMRIQNGEVYLLLDIKNHNDAGIIVEALQRQGMQFAPPTTQNVEDRIQAVLRGKFAQEAVL